MADRDANARVSDVQFRAWVEPLLGRAAAYAFSIVRDRGDAEDAVQEALWRAYRSLGRYDRSRSFRAWWLTVVRNCCLDLLRKRRARPEASIGDSGVPETGGGDPRAGMERRDEILWGLDRLEPLHREVLELRYFGECSYAEIALALGIPEGTVMSRLHAARRALAAILTEERS